ncbi:hypothetical protein DINM_000670 [Dirofilaria immitis]|nr:hypothetical protein [Dirofilaria immitis]
MHKQSGLSHPVARNIARKLPHIPTINNINTERNEAINEIKTMNNLLIEMQKEGDKRSEMLNSVFDKNFDGKIKTCINTRAEMEARAAAFETMIQYETLIKKPIKDITIENIYEGVFGTNLSQTGSTTDELIMSPVEQQQIILENATPRLTRKVADVISPHTTDIMSSNKVINDQISTKHIGTTGKTITKGFSETALTKVGHWSKSAFKFFRTKNASSG